jgi:hypothetical protein
VRGRKEKAPLPDACKCGEKKLMTLTGNISGLFGKNRSEPPGKRDGKIGKIKERSILWCCRVFSIFFSPFGKRHSGNAETMSASLRYVWNLSWEKV